jgi:phenylacetate-CoA ligase
LPDADVPTALASLRSSLAGNAWPTVPSQRGALLLSLLYQLDSTQWWPEGRLLGAQLRQLEGLLRHAYESVPYYRRRFDTLSYRPSGAPGLEEWRRLPLLTRRDIQSAGADLTSRAVPAEHGKLDSAQTSGSTGEPIKVYRTQLDSLLWDAITLREHLWHRRDFSGRLAVIRATTGTAGAPPDGLVQGDWGPPANVLFQTGPSAMLSLATDIAVQAAWLKRHEPDYLLTYPNNLAALIAHFAEKGERPARLKSVRTIGETVTPALRSACLDAWNVHIVDSYSSQELGQIATQCPQSNLYHVMAESVLVEVLGADGRPCRPGEFGRLVVTKLHNFATPLIRYDLGDYAEAGGPCPCGRGLPTLARLLGRSRNLLTLPTGERRWPLVGFAEYREIAPVRQYQLVQLTREDIEARFVVDRPLTAAEEERLAGAIQRALAHPFRLTFVYFRDEIPRGAGGKFEEFMSKLEA